MKKDSVSFEEKLKQLEKLIAEIEAGKDGLNSSIEKYSEAQKLADELSEMLKSTKESLGSFDSSASGELAQDDKSEEETEDEGEEE